jgi:hypothetical protein
MLKAPRRWAVPLGAVALGMTVAAVPSVAEVQNVRVGGDVTVRAFHRENLDLRDDGISNTSRNLDRDDFLMTTMGLDVAADLTENVSAFIRLANERDWNVDSTSSGDIDFSQAYVTLKELLLTPLTLRIGTQPIVWGRGFVLGSNLLPSILLGGGNDRNAAITPNEFTDFTAFDAIRATLDLSGIAGVGTPLTADYVFIRVDENNVGAADDINMQGVNFSANFDAAEVETYYLNYRDKSAATSINDNQGSVNTLGVRGSAQPIAGSYLYGELAYQFGKRVTDLEGILPPGGSHQAWAANLGADYTFGDVAMKPKIGGEWRYYSGKNQNGAVSGWRALAPGYFRTALREFQTRSTVTGFYPNDQTGVTSSQTNQHELGLYGGFKPLEDLNVDQRLAWFVLAVGAIPPTSPATAAKRSSFVGTEWDTVVTYDYTDDVQLGLIYGLFLPGSVFVDGGDVGGRATAQELITSVSVKF